MSSSSIKKILSQLKKHYPDANCALYYKTPFQLLIATILSAQCTDERVNKVTPVLFKKFPTPQKMAKATLEEVEEIIHSTGFFRQKAKSLIFTSRDLVEKFHGRIPPSMEELLKLRGVARKTANVVLGNAYGMAEGVVVDTHVTRLSNRMGFTKEKDPKKIEQDLIRAADRSLWIWLSHAMITHGRQVCKAINPRCEECFLKKVCPQKGIR